MPRRVVITSIGIASPIGLGVDAFWSALRAGSNGVEVFEDGELAAIPPGAGGRIAVPMTAAREFFDPRVLRNATMHGSTLHAVVATGDCLARSGLGEAAKPDYGCYVGTKQHYPPYAKQAAGALILAEGDGGGGWSFDDERLGRAMRAQSAFDFLRTLPNMTGSHVSIRGGFQGPVCTFLGSTASGLQAVIEAWREIRDGRAEGMLAVGAWTPYDTLYMGYLARRGLSAPRGETVARPFDRRRRGMLPADGAAALLLEDLEVARSRGATIVAELMGGASRFAAPGGARDLAARVETLRAGIPDDLALDAIGAEGVGHLQLDELEGLAWHEALGREAAAAAHWIVPSACTGYSGPAASVLATAALALAMRDSVLPPLAGLEDPDPACGPVTPRPDERSAPVRGGAVSAFSFEGIHATLALQAWTGA